MKRITFTPPRSDAEIQASAELDRRNAEWVRAEAARLDSWRREWLAQERALAQARETSGRSGPASQPAGASETGAVPAEP